MMYPEDDHYEFPSDSLELQENLREEHPKEEARDTLLRTDAHTCFILI